MVKNIVLEDLVVQRNSIIGGLDVARDMRFQNGLLWDNLNEYLCSNRDSPLPYATAFYDSLFSGGQETDVKMRRVINQLENYLSSLSIPCEKTAQELIGHAKDHLNGYFTEPVYVRCLRAAENVRCAEVLAYAGAKVVPARRQLSDEGKKGFFDVYCALKGGSADDLYQCDLDAVILSDHVWGRDIIK